MSKNTFSAISQFRLDKEIALITGSGDGLGRIAALTYAEAGAHVCVSDINMQLAEKVVVRSKTLAVQLMLGTSMLLITTRLCA